MDEDDALLPGNHGGRGIGLAGGYPGSQSPPEPRLSLPAAFVALPGAGDDPYAGYDPGMAGCTIEQSTCHIPGLPWMGVSPSQAQAQAQAQSQSNAPHVALPGTSRGYERDADEYADVLASRPRSSSSSVALGTRVADPVPVPVRAGPNSDPFADPDPDPPTGNPGPERPNPRPHPSVGTRLVGRVQRLAGKVLRDPDIEARGKRHMVRLSVVLVPPGIYVGLARRAIFDCRVGVVSFCLKKYASCTC